MAFDHTALENHSGSGKGLKLFSYKTTDNRAAVTAANYFNGGASILRVGDVITIGASDHTFQARVSANAAGVVTVAALSTFA